MTEGYIVIFLKKPGKVYSYKLGILSKSLEFCKCCAYLDASGKTKFYFPIHDKNYEPEDNTVVIYWFKLFTKKKKYNDARIIKDGGIDLDYINGFIDTLNNKRIDDLSNATATLLIFLKELRIKYPDLIEYKPYLPKVTDERNEDQEYDDIDF